MIQTWAADVTPLLGDAAYQRHYDRLPRWRREKADGLRKREDRARSVGVWILYQCMRERYRLSEKGIYNLSHSGRYALCSVEAEDPGRSEKDSSVKLGCDVEMLGEFRPGILSRFLGPEEAARLEKISDPGGKRELFYRYWVLKESFVKATRRGMALDFRSFEICLEQGQPVLGRRPPEYSEQYYFQEYRLPDQDARIAVCSTDPQFGKLRMARVFGD